MQRSGKAASSIFLANIFGMVSAMEELERRQITQRKSVGGPKSQSFTKANKKETKVRRKMAARSRAINRQRGVG